MEKPESIGLLLVPQQRLHRGRVPDNCDRPKTEEILHQIQTQRTQPGHGGGTPQTDLAPRRRQLHFLTSCQSYEDIGNTHFPRDYKGMQGL